VLYVPLVDDLSFMLTGREHLSAIQVKVSDIQKAALGAAYALRKWQLLLSYHLNERIVVASKHLYAVVASVRHVDVSLTNAAYATRAFELPSGVAS
jgi:hypothetical protein